MKPFRVSIDYLHWAHGSGAEDGQPLATKIMDAPGYQMKFKLFDDPQLVAEIADVAELYVGGDCNDLRAAGVRSRAVDWLKERGLTVAMALKPSSYRILWDDPETGERCERTVNNVLHTEASDLGYSLADKGWFKVEPFRE